jgi:hypothetical protein
LASIALIFPEYSQKDDFSQNFVKQLKVRMFQNTEKYCFYAYIAYIISTIKINQSNQKSAQLKTVTKKNNDFR